MTMGRRLTVVQLLPALDAGGVERSTLEIAEALVDAGHRAIVVSAGGRMLPQLAAMGAEHVMLDIGRKSPASLRHVPALRRLFARERVDIVHARSRLPAWLGRLALRSMAGARRPHFVTTVHGLNSPSHYSAVMVSGERIICVSRTVRDYVLRHYPATDPARLQVIERGIDPAAFPRAPLPDTDARSAIASREPALAGDGPLLLLPGRETYVAELAGEAKQLGISDAVAMTEPTSAIARAYAASDLVLQLSHKPEAFGRTVLEALSVGRPVLGWAHGGVGELLQQWWPEGAVVPFDEPALAHAAASLLARPPPLPGTMPDSLRAMQQDTLALYEQLA
jgi:glycosyltransferase involved in cell wall biosynthesis